MKGAMLPPAATPDHGLAVRLRGVRKRFGYRDVLRGIDLEVQRGACLALLGPNGAGKSTLLRIAATAWTASEGEVEVLGRDARRNAIAVRARIGAVFHESHLRRELSLDENFRFLCDLHDLRWSAAEARAEELIEKFQLAHRRRDPVSTFSQGMAKRASIARSLLHRPELWILDEPFSGLDPAGQELLEGMVREFPATGGAVLLVTHDPARGARLASRLVTMEDGRLARPPNGAGALLPAAAAPAPHLP